MLNVLKILHVFICEEGCFSRDNMCCDQNIRRKNVVPTICTGNVIGTVLLFHFLQAPTVLL